MKLERLQNRALCLWLPQWPLGRLQLARPELKRRELILYSPQRGALRVAVSSKRRIPAGVPLAEAMTLLPAAHFEQHDAHADRSALLQLAAWCEQFSPIVGIGDLDHLCLDVTGLGALFGGEEALIEQVLRACRRRGLSVKLGLADTLGSAWAIAHYGKNSLVPPGKTIEALAALPIAALRLDAQCEILAELGIETIGQLIALPREALAVRFDPQLLLRLDQAMGLVAEPILSHRTPPGIEANTELEYPTADRQSLNIVLQKLLEHIVEQLRVRQQGIIQLRCRLECEAGAPVDWIVGVYRATAQRPAFAGTYRLAVRPACASRACGNGAAFGIERRAA